MSVPSWKVTTTCDRPNLESERNCCKPGSPLMACSTGKVICRSTSRGPRPGAIVLICTWTGVVSGKASMLRRCQENQPTTTKHRAAASTIRRLRKDQSMIAVSMRFL